jgi:hypothetical protein
MPDPRFGWVLYDGACGFCAWSYSTFARHRYCVSRACGLDGATNVRR